MAISSNRSEFNPSLRHWKGRVERACTYLILGAGSTIAARLGLGSAGGFTLRECPQNHRRDAGATKTKPSFNCVVSEVQKLARNAG
jgi:hypothetical protein